MDAFGGLRGKIYALALNRQRNVPRPGDAAFSRRTAKQHARNVAHDYRQGGSTVVKVHKAH